ncbi:MAG: hypothetical protein V7K35_14475 [Nostoc sp.]|uniref:hypothetical protein n=1 Tax=Nostoc sp. TaxID=1180 RepID=UPI002FF85D24
MRQDLAKIGLSLQREPSTEESEVWNGLISLTNTPAHLYAGFLTTSVKTLCGGDKGDKGKLVQ